MTTEVFLVFGFMGDYEGWSKIDLLGVYANPVAASNCITDAHKGTYDYIEMTSAPIGCLAFRDLLGDDTERLWPEPQPETVEVNGVQILSNEFATGDQVRYETAEGDTGEL